MRRIVSMFAVGLCISLPACTPKVSVVKNPGDCDEGIRYYRPKPYLLISPATNTITEYDASGQKKAKSTTGIGDHYVNIEMQYLPDFGEEYSINVSPGLGSANVGVTLEDGWNLTGLNQELDTQFDETVTALAELAGAVAPVATGGGRSVVGPASGVKHERRWVVPATNIPLGYYESVVSRDQTTGKKRLYGWRYVGFAPFNGCPLEMAGVEYKNCCDPGAIYGLAFVEGVMVFKQIGTFDRHPTAKRLKRTSVKTGKITIDPGTFGSLKSMLKSIEERAVSVATLKGVPGTTIKAKIMEKKLVLTVSPNQDNTAIGKIKTGLGDDANFKTLVEQLGKLFEGSDLFDSSGIEVKNAKATR